MYYLLIILVSYLVGTSSMSYYMGKLNGVNVSKNGSGNLGASNTVVLFGWKAGIIVALHDILKAFIVVMLARYLFPELLYAGEVAGVSCIIGHIFPFYLKFKGGKGFASYVGMTLALDWKLAVGVIVLAALLTLITDYIVTATLSTIVIVPVYMGVFNHHLIATFIIMIASCVMIFKHLDNIKRILNGTEIGLRSAHKGEHRVS